MLYDLVKRARLLDETLVLRRDAGVNRLTRQEEALRIKTSLERGHGVIDDIHRTLQKLDEYRPRTIRQIQVHEEIIASLAKFIYQNDMIVHELEIKKRNRWTDTKHGLVLSAPRRFGKTESLAMIIAALLYSCPKIEISCVSNSGNAAGGEMGLIGKVRRYLAVLGVVIKPSQGNYNNQHHIWYKVHENDVRLMHSFAATVGDR